MSTYKETRHVFNVHFKNKEIVLGNQYRFNVFPVYWTTEIIGAKASLSGVVYFTVPPTLMVSGSGNSETYTTASLILTTLFSASMNMVSYTWVSGSGKVNKYDASLLA